MSSYMNVSEKQLQLLEMRKNQKKRVALDRLSISSEVRLYSINDIDEMSGWSKRVGQKLFNDLDFPSLDYGKAKLVEAHALIAFLSVKHEKELEPYWRKQVRRHGKTV